MMFCTDAPEDLPGFFVVWRCGVGEICRERSGKEQLHGGVQRKPPASR
jgi:hypothetical protein